MRCYHVREGDPRNWNAGTVEPWNGGMVESRNGGKSPQILQDAMTERWNDGKSPEILKDGMAGRAMPMPGQWCQDNGVSQIFIPSISNGEKILGNANAVV